MQRLILVYNPRSSRYVDVEKEVISRLRHLGGYTIGKYEVKPTNLDDNITQLSKLLKNGDFVLSAGGDATGIIASNGILKSGKDATLAVLPLSLMERALLLLHSISVSSPIAHSTNATAAALSIPSFAAHQQIGRASCRESG